MAMPFSYKRWFFILTIATVCIALVAYYLKTISTTDSNYSLLGEKAPEFSLPIIGTDRLFRLDTENRSSPTVITLWNPQCIECEPYLHYINTLNRQYEHINFVGLVYKSRQQDVEAWISKHGNPFDVLVDDQQGEITKLYKYLGFPESVLIDSTGKIIHWDVNRPVPSLVGYLKQNADNL